MPRTARPLATRLLERTEIDQETGCWLWQGYVQRNGYGYMSGPKKGTRLGVHRVAHEEFIGPIPAGFQVDHLCHNANLATCTEVDQCTHRRCVNPEHLEAVPARVNILRSGSASAVNARRTECKHGHAFTLDNTRYDSHGRRVCRACSQAANQDTRDKTRQIRVSVEEYAALTSLARQRGTSLTKMVRTILNQHMTESSSR